MKANTDVCLKANLLLPYSKSISQHSMYLWCVINKNPKLWCKSVSAFKAIIISSISSVDIYNELTSTDNSSSRYTSHHRVHFLNTALGKTWFTALHFINRLLQRHRLLTYLLNISILQSVCEHENEIWRQSKLDNTRHLNWIYQRLYWQVISWISTCKQDLTEWLCST